MTTVFPAGLASFAVYVLAVCGDETRRTWSNCDLELSTRRSFREQPQDPHSSFHM
jgi:hypothetical protein